ncbi:teichoic acid biosynthesis protein [Bacillus sp. TS-2]|nr:teichoic acid biosynthesis protein [Bacillus sp. TS-2]
MKEQMSNKIKRFIKTIFSWVYSFFSLFPVKERQVLFASDRRNDLSGNFKFIYNEMIRQEKNLNCKFVLAKNRNSIFRLLKLAYLCARSKIIIIDDYFPYVYPIKLRQETELIQVWHAVGAFKRFGFSLADVGGSPNLDPLMHRNYTKAIVSSKKISHFYAEAFQMDRDQIIATGIPRTDIFFDEVYKREKKQELYHKYPFLKEKKVILFAPTFRGKGKNSAYYPNEYIDFKGWYESLKDDYIFLIKWHPYIKGKINIPEKYRSFYYDFSFFEEINDLLFIADLLITDYSSVCFEFALLRKPMLFYAVDVEDYTHSRDFYYEYENFIPGPLVKNSNELIQFIKTQNFDIEVIDQFIERFYDHTDGQSSKRFVNELIKSK